MVIEITKIKPAYIASTGDLLPKLQMAYCLDPSGFIDYLKTIGVIFDGNKANDDLNTLAAVYKAGTDKDGTALKQKIDLNIFLDGFVPSKESINASDCKFV